MPTVLRRDGFEVCIYPHDHPPCHVHVWRSGKQVVINLGEGSEIATISKVRGMPKNHVRKAYAIVEKNLQHLRDRWREIHG